MPRGRAAGVHWAVRPRQLAARRAGPGGGGGAGRWGVTGLASADSGLAALGFGGCGAARWGGMGSRGGGTSLVLGSSFASVSESSPWSPLAGSGRVTSTCAGGGAYGLGLSLNACLGHKSLVLMRTLVYALPGPGRSGRGRWRVGGSLHVGGWAA